MNVHNWTNKFVDGLLVNEAETAERIVALFPADHARYKRWQVEVRADWLKANNVTETPEANKSWKNYCDEQFGAISVNFELPWFGISTAAMEEKGRKAMVALALTAVELRNL